MKKFNHKNKYFQELKQKCIVKNTGFSGLKNLLPTQLSQLAPSQAPSNYPAAPWSAVTHFTTVKPKTLNKKVNQKSTQSSQSQPRSPNRQNLDSSQQLKRDLACFRLVSKTVNALTHEVPERHGLDLT